MATKKKPPRGIAPDELAARTKAPRASVPFGFVLDRLAPLSPTTRAMFGAHAIYVGERIVMIVREKKKDADDGVWIATFPEHHASLRKELPSLRSIEVFGASGETAWQIIPTSATSFEDEARHACALVLRGDPRIGKIPSGKKARAASSAERFPSMKDRAREEKAASRKRR